MNGTRVRVRGNPPKSRRKLRRVTHKAKSISMRYGVACTGLRKQTMQSKPKYKSTMVLPEHTDLSPKAQVVSSGSVSEATHNYFRRGGRISEPKSKTKVQSIFLEQFRKAERSARVRLQLAEAEAARVAEAEAERKKRKGETVEPPKPKAKGEAVRLCGKNRKTKAKVRKANYKIEPQDRQPRSALGIPMGKEHFLPQAEVEDHKYDEDRKIREFEKYGPSRIPRSDMTPTQCRPVIGTGEHHRVHEGKAK